MERIKVVLIITVLFCGANSITRDDLYPFGTTQRDTRLEIGDDLSSDEVYLETPIAFYDELHRSIFVNLNGLLTFGRELPAFRPDLLLPFGFKVIAPFFADIDISLSGNVYYRETQQRSLLDKAGRDIANLFPNAYGFQPYSLFIATWDEVGYYNSKYDRINTFQVVIASDGIDSYVCFHYTENGIQWVTSDGKYHPSNPDVPAQVGFDAGDQRRSFTLPGSGNPEVQMLNKWSNVNVPGVWLFRIGNSNGGDIEVPEREDDFPNQPSSCSTGGSLNCHSNANCIDHRGGFCCECQPGFYGNGLNCIKPGLAQRVSGKLKGRLNGVFIDSVDLHAYIVTNDGRSFTAISRIPPSIGHAMQTLYVIGDVLGWLFALPLSPRAKNGFALTGGEFNRTVVISFTSGSQKVTVTQTAHARDALGYMSMDTEVNGEMPQVPSGAMKVKDFSQEFRRVSAGTIKSFSTRAYTVGEMSYRFTVDETIKYKECDASPFDDIDTMRLSVSRAFVVYGDKEAIVRYATTNRVARGAADVIGGSPCVDQDLNCDSNADCVQHGTFYRCQCREGYRGDGQYCEDIDECRDLNECHPELARCINTPGTYRCECLPGYVGDGRRCRRDQTCADIQCHVNGRCVYDSENSRPKCECGPGFYGDGIELCTPVEDQDCNTLRNCDRNARCVIDIRSGQYHCVCEPGYNGDGYYCDIDNDDGEPTCDIVNNCAYDAECLYNPETLMYECHCKAGYRGTGIECVREDCSIEDFCDANARCIFDYEVNAYECHCNDGFEGNGRQCRATVVECNQVNNCDANADCLQDARSRQYICRCRQGYEGNGYNCKLIANCQENPGLCDVNARCQRSGVEFVCACNPGYRGDGFRCTSTSAGGNYLLVNQGMSILEVPFQPTSGNGGKLLMHVPGQLAVGVDVDCYERYFYWTDVVGKTVSRAKMDGTDSSVLLQDLDSPEGVAIDWIARNMYITDSGSDTISVAKLDGSESKILVGNGLVNPRSIQVDPVRGLMFWTDWNRAAPKIERANMDGTDRITLVSEGLVLPNGLTIDSENERVCWADAGTRKLECTGYEPDRRGRQHRLIHNEALYPFGVTHANGNFYWTDWEMNTLPNINEFDNQPNVPLSIPLGGNGKLYGLVAVKDQCLRGTNACYYNNGGCRFLCLPSPGGRRTCACPDNIEEAECNRIGLLL